MDLSTRLLLTLLILLRVSSAVGVRTDRRELSDAINAQCASLVAQTTLANVSFVVEPACNISKVAMDGCVPLTACQFCRTQKTALNEHFISCSVLQGWQLQSQPSQETQEQVTAAKMAVQTDELAFQGETSTTTATLVGSKTVDGLTTTEVFGVVIVAVSALVGGVLVIKRYRQRRMEEDALGTPKSADGALVSVQSRTQIATI